MYRSPAKKSDYQETLSIGGARKISEFRKRVDEAIITGTESVNDLAESKLIGHINSGNLRAIQYWLDNNKKNYARPRPKDFGKVFKGITV